MVNQQRIYCFLSDDSKMFYRATQLPTGDYTITKNARPYPIKYNPSNLLNTSIEFATNTTYFSMVRSINYPLDFIKDGAAILRAFYFLGKNVMQKCYLTMIQWNGTTNIYELAYYGRIDLGQKKEDPKSGTFTVPCIDDSAWGLLSQHDDVEYAIDCNATNTKAIKVLVDSINLINRYTFQTVQAPITDSRVEDQFQSMPFVLINEDGDSAGLVVTGQTLAPLYFDNHAGPSTWTMVDPLAPGYFILTQYPTTIKISGTIKFEWSVLNNANGEVGIFIASNKKTYPATGSFAFGNVIASVRNLIVGKIYEFNYDFTLDLDADERLFLVISMEAPILDEFTITPLINNSTLSTTTKAQPSIIYGLRPLDYLQQLVAKATNNRFTINSSWFTTNNKDIVTCGDAIRQVPDAKIYGSFKDFFQTFNAIYFLALRVVNGDLFIEKATEVYKNSGVIIDIGDAIDIQLQPAMEYYGNEIEVGGTNQDYRHPSGRLEFNVPNTFSLPIDISSGNKKLVYVTKYRIGCYDIMFMILDYQNQSTQDNSGDKNVYLLSITDEQAMAVDNIETFENVNIDNAPLEPIIKQPLNNDTITNSKPVIRGIAPPGSLVSIYADTILDGTTVTDVDGNWNYVLVNPLTPYTYPTLTGIHIIQASYTDLSAPNSTITILITSDITPCLVVYPQPADNLYNNIPLIKGVAQFGDTVQVLIDGVSIGTLVADDSCKWQLYPPVISNGAHILTVIDGAQTVNVNFNVDSNVDYPLITYINSELDGFLVITGLPLIKGVAKPGTDIDLWLNYISYRQLNWDSVVNSRIPIIADANGNWSFQVIPVNYLDPLTGLPVILAPIINGLNIISTSLINHVVGIVVLGYKLNRPAYSSITGVPDNTVFNTLYSSKRMLASQYPMLSAVLKPQPLESIIYQTSPKNGTLRTVLGTEIVQENANIPVSSLGTPLVLLEKAIVKTKTNKTFAQTLYDFINGGTIKTNFRGTDLYFVPIGSMKIANISSDVQEWTILMSPQNSYLDLLNLYKNGLLIKLNKNSMYHSDRNSLHLVTYGFTPSDKYNFIEIYDDWFSRRNSAWVLNPDYIQKFQTSEIIKDQIIINGASSLTLQIFRCKDASLVDTINYVPVSPAPINPPNVVLEAEINWGSYATDQYFTILFSGTTPIAIGERVQTKTKWLGTILIESNDEENDVGFFYSTGIKSILRVEGLVKKLQPSINTIIAQEESGDTEILYAQNSKKRIIRFGTAYGLPDYLYLKVADALTNSNCLIENVSYTLDKDEKINPSDDVDGHPLFYYNVNMTLRDNDKGKTFEVPGDNTSVILVVQGQAIGLPPDSLLNITLDKE